MKIILDFLAIAIQTIVQIIRVYQCRTGMRFDKVELCFADYCPVRVSLVFQVKITQPTNHTVDILATEIVS